MAEQLGIEGPLLGLALPYVPVQSFRHRFFGHGSKIHRWRIVDAKDHADTAEPTPANEVASQAVHRHGALLAAHLKNTVILAHRADQRAPFAYINRHRPSPLTVPPSLH